MKIKLYCICCFTSCIFFHSTVCPEHLYIHRDQRFCDSSMILYDMT